MKISDLHSQGQNFTVVEFLDNENSVAIINSSWLTPRKREAFWPPTKDQKHYQKILRNSDPEFSNWQLYEVRCLYETDDLEKARQKLKLSEITSDLQSETEVPKKRKVIKKVISSEEEIEDDPFPRPPKIKKVLKRQHLTNVNQLIEYDENSRILPLVEIRDTPHNSPCKFNAKIDTGCSTPSAGNTPLSSRVNNEENKITTAFQEKVILLLTQIKEQNSKILQMYKEEKKTTSLNIISDLPVQLPVETEEQLNIFEHYLNDEEKLSLLVKYLSTIGGGDLASRVNRILKHLLSDSVACLYNFYGKRSNKKPFYSLHLRTAVVDGIRLTSPTTSEHDIENAIKVWLKHGPERLKKKQNIKLIETIN